MPQSIQANANPPTETLASNSNVCSSLGFVRRKAATSSSASVRAETPAVGFETQGALQAERTIAHMALRFARPALQSLAAVRSNIYDHRLCFVFCPDVRRAA